MFMEGLGLEANERANKAALLLAHERYTNQFAAFVKGQERRLSYIETQVADMLDECAEETNADPVYVKDRFSAFLRETVKSEIPADSTGIKNDTPSDLDEFTKTDVMDRGEVPDLGLDEALNEGVDKEDLGELTLPYDKLQPTVAAQIKEAMTAKDFVLIASVLAQNNADPVLVDAFADALTHTNEMFDRARFIAAASGNSLTGRDAPRPTPGSLDGLLSKCVRCDGKIEDFNIKRGGQACIKCTVELRQAARSDYDHWNEDADRMWWEEEGKHPYEPEYDDHSYEHGRDAEDAAWEELDEYMRELPPDDLEEIAAGHYAGHLPYADKLDPSGVKDLAANVLADLRGQVDPNQGDSAAYAERGLRGGKKQGDAAWNQDGMGSPTGTGTAIADPSQQGLVQPQDPMSQYTCELCGQQGTQQEMLQHVQNDHADVLQRMQQNGEQMQPTQPMPPYPTASKKADADPAAGDTQPAEVQPLPETPGDRFDTIVQDLAERAAARHFSTPTDADFHSLAQQLSVDEQQIRENLYAYALFGNYAGVNGELTDNATPPDGYEPVQLQNGSSNAHQAQVPTDLVVSKVAEDMNLDDNLASQMIRDHYGGVDLPAVYNANVQGQQTFYLPSELAGNQSQDQQPQQQPAQYDPTVGPAFQQTPPGAPVPAQQPSPAPLTQ